MTTLSDPPSSRRPVLAVVSGLPATGKTSLSQQLRSELGWPLFAKDDFKERLFDHAGIDGESFDRSQSTVIGRQALAIMFMVAQEVLEAGHSCIIEANLLPALAPDDLAPLAKVAELRQVHCAIPDSLVIQRYQERANAGERHPVHADAGALDDLVQRIESGAGRPLPLDAPLLAVDGTTDFDPGIEKIVAFFRA